MFPPEQILPSVPVLRSGGNKPLKLTFGNQMNALILFHLQECDPARHLIQMLNGDDSAKTVIASEYGISRSSFCEAVNRRGSEQLLYVFQKLSIQAEGISPEEHSRFGDTVLPDGTLTDAVLSMHWADYRKNSEKAEAHFCFNLNQSIPEQTVLTEGRDAERPFAEKFLSCGQTGVTDRGYQCHKLSDRLRREGKHSVCRIKQNTALTVIKENPVRADSYIFYDAAVLLGTSGRTEMPLRVTAYRIRGKKYVTATDRDDLTAEQIAAVHKLRWNIGTFFKRWKQHLRIYHLTARSGYGPAVQIFGGLITYLLMAIRCYNKHKEKVSLYRFRELRIDIQNELRQNNIGQNSFCKEQQQYHNSVYAKT